MDKNQEGCEDMHIWGDEWFQKNSLTLRLAIRLFQGLNDLLRGPFFLTKEKYGTMRIEYFMLTPMIDIWLFRQNVVFIHSPRLNKIANFLYYVFKYTGINYIILKYQRFIFNLITFVTVKKYPEVKEEILDEFEFEDLLYSYVKKRLSYICNWKTYKRDVKNA